MSQSIGVAPYAEPLWCSRGYSPYYNESHFRLRKEVREYVDKEITPFAAEWEKNGYIPSEVSRSYHPDSRCRNHQAALSGRLVLMAF